MKKCILITIILSPLLLCSLGHAETKAQCTMQYQNAKHGTKNIGIFSDHIFTITNNTGMTKVYHIEYENMIMFQNPYYSPNAKFSHEVAVNNGQTFQATLQRINRNASFSIEGNYPTQATTVIFLDGKVIARCSHKNIAAIF